MLRPVDISAIPVPYSSFDKTAFMAMGKLLGGALRKWGPTGLSKMTNPLAQRAENALVGGATNFLKTDPTKTRQLLRGTMHAGIRDAASGAVGGAVFGGGLGALTAEPGQRGQGFLAGARSGALQGAGFGAVTGLGSGLVRNAQGMHFQNLAKSTGVSPGRLATRAKNMGWRDTMGKAFKAPDAMNPMGKVDQGIARAKLIGGAGLLGAEFAPDVGMHIGTSEPAPEGPKYQPNAPAVYSQPQYYKSSSAKIQLRAIDFTNLPSYHK